MSRANKFIMVFLVVFAAFFNIAVCGYQPDYEKENITVEIVVSSDVVDTYAVYYNTIEQDDGEFYGTQVATQSYNDCGDEEILSFSIPANVDEIRFDPTESIVETSVKGINIVKNGVVLEEIAPLNFESITRMDISENASGYTYQTTANDGYVVYRVDSGAIISGLKSVLYNSILIKKVLAAVIVDLLLIYILLHLNKLLIIPKEVWREKKLVASLGKNDFKTRFAGSYLGIVWAFVQPVVTVVVYWFVFEKALNAGTQSTKAGITVPYVLWLVAGLVPWFYFSELISTGTNVFLEYSYLVKKVVFNISSLPIVKVISSLFVHMFFIAFTFILYACYGYFPSLYMLQVIYYTFAAVVLGVGLVYLTSAISVFFRDLSQIVNIILQIGVWFTPIMWNIDAMTLTAPVIFILKLNPMYYVVMGYRDSLINKVWFWENPGQTIYFWVVTILILIFGTSVFRRLKVHFADVL